MPGKENRSQTLLNEIAGGLGDVGVFVPLALALVIENGFDLQGIFLAAGLFYLLSGTWFGIPMPVQPLKAMAAIALASGLSQEVLHVAGIEFGAIMLLLLIPGAAGILQKLFPLPVIRGIQLALGIILAKTGVSMALGSPPLAMLAAALFAATLLFIRALPPILPVLAAGVIIAIVRGDPASVAAAGPAAKTLSPVMSLDGLLFPLVALVIPQLGLTVGNSVMATIQTAKDLFRERSRRVTLRSLATSIGIGNVLSPLLGGIPMCHGSGGLTAHYRFGARTGRATATVGALFLLIALLPGRYSQHVLFGFPLPFLGVPLVIVGVFHALLARKILVRGNHAAAAVVTALASVLTHNLTAGAALGLVTFKIQESLVYILAKRKALREKYE
ncbi:MAG: hypothetical protein GTN70_08115 [Deltaproteobacteria bacterium]|nr:hypothetical protein [Deltaproteobacteria bacterium]NIS77664.1 hypothetical protein [Deltaproteobacteria bacterium]